MTHSHYAGLTNMQPYTHIFIHTSTHTNVINPNLEICECEGKKQLCLEI